MGWQCHVLYHFFSLFLTHFLPLFLPKVRLYKEGLGWLPRFVSGESHGFLRPGQRSPWGAGILNKPKKLSFAKSHFHGHFSPKIFFSSFPLIYYETAIFSLSFGLELNFKRGIARRYLEQIKFGLRRYFSSCIVIWEPHFLLVNTPCTYQLIGQLILADICWSYFQLEISSLWSGLQSSVTTSWSNVK